MNDWSEQKLGQIFKEYGEEPKWRLAARLIVNARSNQEIKTTFDLVNVLKPLYPPRYGKEGIHPATLVFQALRIAVNEELEVLEEILLQTLDVLSKGGRMGVITFHSLEDRIVKKFFKSEANDRDDEAAWHGVIIDKQPKVKILTKKPLISSKEEINLNPRSRSAKLRFIEKL